MVPYCHCSGFIEKMTKVSVGTNYPLNGTQRNIHQRCLQCEKGDSNNGLFSVWIFVWILICWICAICQRDALNGLLLKFHYFLGNNTLFTIFLTNCTNLAKQLKLEKLQNIFKTIQLFLGHANIPSVNWRTAVTGELHSCQSGRNKYQYINTHYHYQVHYKGATDNNSFCWLIIIIMIMLMVWVWLDSFFKMTTATINQSQS